MKAIKMLVILAVMAVVFAQNTFVYIGEWTYDSSYTGLIAGSQLEIICDANGDCLVYGVTGATTKVLLTKYPSANCVANQVPVASGDGGRGWNFITEVECLDSNSDFHSYVSFQQ
jgi:hypothetical protein